MKATLNYNDGHRVDIDLNRSGVVPVIRYQGHLFVNRAYVLGFIDNLSREGQDQNMYMETSVWNVDRSEVEEL